MRRLMTVAAAAAVGFSMAAGGAAPARADKVTDAIAKAKEYYDAGNLPRANARLQYAIGQIARKLQEIYSTTFPPAPDGWRVRERRRRGNQSMMFMQVGTVINKTYNEQDGRGYIQAQLVVDSAMMTAMMGTLGNPAMAQRMGYEQVDMDGYPQGVLIKFDEDRRRGEAVAMIAGRIFLKVSGQNLENDKILRQLLSTWKIAELKQAVGIK